MIENNYVISLDILKEFHWGFYIKIKYIIVFFVIILLSIISCIVLAFIQSTDIPLYIASIFIFMLIIYFIRLIRAPKLQYNRECELNNGMPPYKAVTAEDDFAIRDSSTNGVRRISYEMIARKYETKNLYVLLTKTNVGIIFKKDSFTAGGLEQLKEIVNEKCVNCK